MNILVTGTSGFLGEHLVREITSNTSHSVIALDRESYPPSHDLAQKVVLIGDRDIESVGEMLEGVEIDAVIHSAAMSSFGGCENQPELAERVNVRYTEALRDFARERGAHLSFISTDLLFDGNELPTGKGFSEEDLPNPTSVYARTKSQGEQLFDTATEDVAIFRASLMYGPRAGRNGGPLGWILSAISAGDPVTVFHDEWRTLLYVRDLTQILLKAAEGRVRGLFHCGGPERMSRSEMISVCLRRAGASEHPVREVSRLSIPGPKRPEDVSLLSSKVCDAFGVALTPYEQGISESLR